jgi:3-phenylpropionate/trans-cinnamate dioxygenase ferredoxin subunit
VVHAPAGAPANPPPTPPAAALLAGNEFRIADLPAGQTTTVKDGTILVCNIGGAFYATDEACTHMQGPLSAGMLNGKIVTCPLHGSCFDVTTGAVTRGPATLALKTYAVTVDGEVGRVTVG